MGAFAVEEADADAAGLDVDLDPHKEFALVFARAAEAEFGGIVPGGGFGAQGEVVLEAAEFAAAVMDLAAAVVPARGDGFQLAVGHGGEVEAVVADDVLALGVFGLSDKGEVFPLFAEGVPGVGGGLGETVFTAEAGVEGEDVLKAAGVESGRGAAGVAEFGDAGGGVGKDGAGLQEEGEDEEAVLGGVDAGVVEKVFVEEVARGDEGVGGDGAGELVGAVAIGEAEAGEVAVIEAGAHDDAGLGFDGDRAGEGEEVGLGCAGERAEELFEMVGEEPVVVVEDGEVVALDGVQAGPEAGAAIAAGAFDDFDGFDVGPGLGLDGGEVDVLVADEDEMEAAVGLAGEGGDGAVDEVDGARAAADDDADEGPVALAGAGDGVVAAAVNEAVVFDGVGEQDFAAEAGFEDMAGVGGALEGGGGVAVHLLAGGEDLFEEERIGEALIDVIEAVAEVFAEPGGVAGDGEGADGGDFEDAIGDDVVAEVFVGEQAEAGAALGVFGLDGVAVEGKLAAVAFGIEAGPGLGGAADDDAVLLAHGAEHAGAAFIPVGAEVGNAEAAFAEECGEAGGALLALAGVVVDADVLVTADGEGDVAGEVDHRVGQGEPAVVSAEVIKEGPFLEVAFPRIVEDAVVGEVVQLGAGGGGGEDEIGLAGFHFGAAGAVDQIVSEAFGDDAQRLEGLIFGRVLELVDEGDLHTTGVAVSEPRQAQRARTLGLRIWGINPLS